MQITSSPLPQVHLHLFGAATPAGTALMELVLTKPRAWLLFGYSRNPSKQEVLMHRADFHDPESFYPQGDPSFCECAVWISFGPIWLLAPFLEQLAVNHPERLRGIRGLIACSSSSVITKRFAANKFDRQLRANLYAAEHQMISTCRRLQIPLRILRPTLIYGQVGPYGDRNLSRLLVQLRRLPLLPLPAETGLRQPIHASQLAAVTFQLAKQLITDGWDPNLPECIGVGGDSELSYTAMIRALQRSLPQDDQARCCRLLPVPNRLFFLFAAFLLLLSPKAFEAVLRMGADLSGFTPAHQLLDEPPQPFPIQPVTR